MRLISVPRSHFKLLRSHFKLLQEDHAHDPWRMLVICKLLNVTTGRQGNKRWLWNTKKVLFSLILTTYFNNSDGIERKENKSRTVKTPRNPRKEEENVVKKTNGVTTAKKNKPKLIAAEELDEAYQRKSPQNT